MPAIVLKDISWPTEEWKNEKKSVAALIRKIVKKIQKAAALRRKKHQKRTDLQKSKVLKQTLLLKKILYRNGSLSKGRLFFKWHFSYEKSMIKTCFIGGK